MPVFFTMGNGPTADANPAATIAEKRRGYLDEQVVLMRWMRRYPAVKCSLTHGFNYRLWLNEDQVRHGEARSWARSWARRSISAEERGCHLTLRLVCLCVLSD